MAHVEIFCSTLVFHGTQLKNTPLKIHDKSSRLLPINIETRVEFMEMPAGNTDSTNCNVKYPKMSGLMHLQLTTNKSSPQPREISTNIGFTPKYSKLLECLTRRE